MAILMKFMPATVWGRWTLSPIIGRLLCWRFVRKSFGLFKEKHFFRRGERYSYKNVDWFSWIFSTTKLIRNFILRCGRAWKLPVNLRSCNTLTSLWLRYWHIVWFIRLPEKRQVCREKKKKQTKTVCYLSFLISSHLCICSHLHISMVHFFLPMHLDLHYACALDVHGDLLAMRNRYYICSVSLANYARKIIQILLWATFYSRVLDKMRQLNDFVLTS